jgi:hypothetical protein
MKVTPSEAEESLADIQNIMQKTRQSIASSNAHISLIITGSVWMIGFLCTQFLSGEIVLYIWIGLSVFGTALASILSMRMGKRIHSPSAAATAKRIGLTWLLLAVFCAAAIAVAWPLDGKQLTVFIMLFVMIGWLEMGVLLSFIPIWPGLIIIALVLTGYFFLPNIFYLWIAILGGGGMIALGVYIRSRW